MAGVRTEDERDVGPSWRIWRQRQDRPRGDEVRRESGMRSAAGESSTAPWPPPTPIGGCAAPCRGSWPSRCRALANPAVGTRAPRHGQALFLFPLPRLSARGGRKGRVSLRSIKTAQLQSNGRERYRGWTVFHLPSTPGRKTKPSPPPSTGWPPPSMATTLRRPPRLHRGRSQLSRRTWRS